MPRPVGRKTSSFVVGPSTIDATCEVNCDVILLALSSWFP
jgi:hypothetical protein